MIPITPQKIKDCGDLGKHTCRVREEGSNSQTLSTSGSAFWQFLLQLLSVLTSNFDRFILF